MSHLTHEELEAGLPGVLDAPKDEGPLRLIVRRPTEDGREIIEEGTLDTEHGLLGDDWENRPGRDGQPARYAQVTVMNARYAELIAASSEAASWAPAGDQLYLDMDISVQNLPPGAQLAVGEAILEFNAEPHTGCAKFSARFGSEAWKLANSERGRAQRLRGANTTVVRSGTIRTGDIARKLET